MNAGSETQAPFILPRSSFKKCPAADSSRCRPPPRIAERRDNLIVTRQIGIWQIRRKNPSEENREKDASHPSLFCVFRVIWTPCPHIYNANGTEERQLTRFQPFARHIRSIFISGLARFSLKCIPIRAA